MTRAGAFVVLASAALLACTFTRSLDYLQDGLGEPDASDGSSSSGSTSGSTSSSSGSTGGLSGAEIVKGELNPTNLIQDESNLYWTNDNNQIMRVSKSGGEPKELAKLAVTNVGAVEAISIDPKDGTLFLLLDGNVKTLSREGGAPADFLTTGTTTAIAADDTFLFAINVDENDKPTLVRYPKENASQPTVIGPPAGEFSDPGALVLFEDSVYWTINDADFVQIVHQLPKTAATGTAPTVWKSTAKNLDKETAGVYALSNFELAVDDDGIYWIDDLDAIPYRLLRAQPIADGPALLNAATGATAITVDERFIYVLTSENVVKLGKTDGSRDAYAIDPTTTAVINDEANLYTIYAGDGVKATGGIFRVPK